MARPKKKNVEYFPHYVSHGKKMSYLEKKFGNDGYCTWFKILEELGSAENHYLDLNDDIQIMFISDRCLISEEKLIEIIEVLVRLKEFDSELWNENKIIWCAKFIESINDAYIKRTNNCINRDELISLLEGLGVRKPIDSEINVVSKPQSRVNNTILEETKEDNIKLNKVLMSEIKISDVPPEQIKYFEIAEAFRNLFIKNLQANGSTTSNQEKAKYKNYVNPIRLMMESDNVTQEQLKIIFKYLDSNQGEFWKKNILSTEKLRKQAEKLIMNANEKPSSKGFDLNIQDVYNSDVAQNFKMPD
mgnify:CR=1 FL=1